MFSKLGLDQGIQWTRKRRMERFWIDGLWDKTVVFDEIDSHIPLATIAHGFMCGIADPSIVERTVRIFNR